jgi:hypothetical protein
MAMTCRIISQGNKRETYNPLTYKAIRDDGKFVGAGQYLKRGLWTVHQQGHLGRLVRSEREVKRLLRSWCARPV